ncbi:MAG: hypothetical protein RL654_1168 [Pseudomonadota bacterium]|jgi:hypothetical protein
MPFLRTTRQMADALTLGRGDGLIFSSRWPVSAPGAATGLAALRAGGRLRDPVHGGAIGMHRGAVIEGHMIRCVGRVIGWQ